MVTICCFVRLRIPRTKAEIEANAKRRALLRDFRAKLRNLKAAELDDMDYRRGKRRRGGGRGGFPMTTYYSLFLH